MMLGCEKACVFLPNRAPPAPPRPRSGFMLIGAWLALAL